MTELFQQTSEWLEVRKSKIGASDAGSVIGLNRWKTPIELWEEKMGIRTQVMNSRMQLGQALEDQARDKFCKEHGLLFFPKVLFHKKYEWMMASPDGIDIENKYLLEIKCPGKRTHDLALSRKVPIYYYAQMQHQMEVCEKDSVFYYSFYKNQGITLICQRDQAFIDKMIEFEEKFYTCMQNFIHPDYSTEDWSKNFEDTILLKAA